VNYLMLPASPPNLLQLSSISRFLVTPHRYLPLRGTAYHVTIFNPQAPIAYPTQIKPRVLSQPTKRAKSSADSFGFDTPPTSTTNDNRVKMYVAYPCPSHGFMSRTQLLTYFSLPGVTASLKRLATVREQLFPASKFDVPQCAVVLMRF
jgi:hypothetical protein